MASIHARVKVPKGTLHQSLSFPKQKTGPVIAYSDADWGNCRTTRRSVTGYLAMFHDCLILWRTRKQPCVSLSTAEAEYPALTDLTGELLWL